MAEAFPGGSKQSSTAVCRRLVKWDSRRTNLFKSGSAGEPLQTSDSQPKSRRERDEEEEAAGFQVPHHFQQHESPLFAPSPLAAATASTEYGQLLLHPPPSLAQRLQSNPAGVRGMRGAGEIVEVQGGHIVRSTGRKDRHSKVCTAKGPRDRRVRLAAHTAIQFYDVQDRLGYDRPSKAVDWLMKNAKAAIDELAELPAWHPTAGPQEPYNPSKNPMPAAEPASSPSFSFAVAVDSRGRSGHPISNFLPPSLDSDSIADTIKSFFPVTAADESAPAPPPSSISQVGFQSYPSDLLSSACSQSQDLRLSLQSFQDSTFHHSPALNPASAGFSEPNLRMISIWNTAAGGGGSDDYIFNKSPAVFGQGQLFSQRGTLQSSNMPFIRPWVDTIGNEMQQVLNPSASSFGFASSSGFRIPARIQGEEELGGVSDKQASGSFASNHQ